MCLLVWSFKILLHLIITPLKIQRHLCILTTVYINIESFSNQYPSQFAKNIETIITVLADNI